MKTLVRSFTKDEFTLQFFCAGGPGGQHQNKVATACRIIHKGSGLAAESREHRSQHANRKAAFQKLAQLLVNHYYPTIPKERAPYTDRVRTYHEPRATVLDHRTGISYNYDDVLKGGGLAEVIDDCIKNGVQR